MRDKTTNSTPAFGFFRAQVRGLERLSPTFLRVTFGGEALRGFGNPERTLDQRIKLVFPGVHGLPYLDEGSTFTDWKSLSEGKRGFMRTYSIRDLRVEPGGGTELAVDFALHGVGTPIADRNQRAHSKDHNAGPDSKDHSAGPGTQWAQSASIGDEILIYGPRRGRFDGGGIEFQPSDSKSIILVGDETAVPAATRILEETSDSGVRVAAFLEVPTPADALPVKVGVEQSV